MPHPAPRSRTTPPSKPGPPRAHPHRGALAFIPTFDGRLHPLLRVECYTRSRSSVCDPHLLLLGRHYG
uniref:Uncharacterized protein n=1 Tax=Oryza glaberrima TaxID=4538 RepID=I1QMU8_ORYGL